MNDPCEPAKRAALRVMAKMALCDGRVGAREEAYLRDMVAVTRWDIEPHELCDTVREASLADLVGQVEKYEDKFFIALRAYAIAHIDGDYHHSEVEVFTHLVELLGIEASDLTLIEETERQQDAEVPVDPDPRLFELYRRSSFANGEERS